MHQTKWHAYLIVLLTAIVTVPQLHADLDSAAPGLNYTLPTAEQIKAVLDRVKNHLVLVTRHRIVDSKTGAVLPDTTTRADARPETLPGKHSLWSYEMGVAYAGMALCTEATGDPAYLDFAEQNFRFFFDHLRYFPRATQPNSLDACGSMGAALLKLNAKRPDPRYRRVIDIIADHISHKQFRLQDGTLARRSPQPESLWTDDLYMSVPFLAQMGKFTGDLRYFDDAVKQILQFSQRVFDPGKELFDHAWFSNLKYDPRFFWGRQNGWALMAMAELLSVLPEDHPGRDKVLDILRRNVRALTELQSPNGLWHQMLDKEETYLETSCTAMFAFAIARGVNRGWIEPHWAPVAQTAWRAVEGKVMADGQIEGVCTGTSASYDMIYYANRPANLLAYHGYGPVFMAGAEMIRLLQTYNVETRGNSFHYKAKSK